MVKNKILLVLAQLFPDAKCELDYRDLYELTVAVILSAQTTDKRVNIVSPALFNKYPDFLALAKAQRKDLEKIISSVGLYQSKAANLINMAKQVSTDFKGKLPNTLNELLTLSGVGRKTANVILSEGFHLPALAVDTHVKRVAKRLELSDSDNPDLVEMDLKKLFDISEWQIAHHLLIHFGRYICKAKKPDCQICPLTCKYRLTPYEKMLL